VTRTQLRPFMSPQEQAAVYSRPYDHTRWPEHVARVARTVQFITDLGQDVAGAGWDLGVDLSCGDGAILTASLARGDVQEIYLGDLVYAGHLAAVGLLEETLPRLAHRKTRAGLLVMSETIEHLRDPDQVLRAARQVADWLVVTTPTDETAAHGNPEHYWSWGVADVEEMLRAAGWNPRAHELLPMPWYTYQLWGCSR
jgi:hypothetical protein